MTRLIAAAIVLLFSLSIAEARVICPRNPDYPCSVSSHYKRAKVIKARRTVSPAPIMQQVAGAVSAPARFIFGRLTCALNVNSALAERGIKGTGSALAKSFLGWGKPSGPVPGAVAIYDRGGIKGHVAIVSRVVNGRVYVWNPGRSGWREIPYSKPAIAYRVASL